MTPSLFMSKRQSCKSVFDMKAAGESLKSSCGINDVIDIHQRLLRRYNGNVSTINRWAVRFGCVANNF